MELSISGEAVNKIFHSTNHYKVFLLSNQTSATKVMPNSQTK
jgi:hypothetical protein